MEDTDFFRTAVVQLGNTFGMNSSRFSMRGLALLLPTVCLFLDARAAHAEALTCLRPSLRRFCNVLPPPAFQSTKTSRRRPREASAIRYMIDPHHKDDEDDNRRDKASTSSPFWMIDVLDRVGTTLLQPLPVINVAIGWVMVLFLQAAVSGTIQALVAALVFGTLRVLAQRLIFFEETLNEDEIGIPIAPGLLPDEQDEKELQFRIDAAMLFLSILAAQLLVPEGWADVTTTGVFIVALFGLVAVVLTTSVEQIDQEEQLSKDEKLLNQWDKRYRQQQSKANQEESEENY